MHEFRRRCRLYGARAFSTLPFAGLKHPCYFLHMPKCGGTSVAAGLYGTVPLNKRIGTIDAVATRRAAAIRHFSRDDVKLCHEDLPHGHLTFALREEMLLMHMSWGTELIHGHVLFSDDAQVWFGKTYKTVTLLRDPFERTVSNYRMAVRAGVIENDLDAWLNSPVSESMARVYLRYFSGKTVIERSDASRLESLARANMAKVDLIGFLEDLDGFVIRFGAMFGATPSIPCYNIGSSEPVNLTRQQAGKLETLLEPDRRLYALALSSVESRNKINTDASASPERAQQA